LYCRVRRWIFILGFYSLVDDRCLDRIHVIRVPSEYRMDLPTKKKGGPSPRILALASHERLTFNRAATSFGVSTSSGSADGLWGVGPLEEEERDVITEFLADSPSASWQERLSEMPASAKLGGFEITRRKAA
jgi:hypothetical protein